MASGLISEPPNCKLHSRQYDQVEVLRMRTADYGMVFMMQEHHKAKIKEELLSITYLCRRAT